jgi:MFS family permease
MDNPGRSGSKSGTLAPVMKEQRWLRIIPVALIMYTISYIDRTNVALALDPKLSPMMAFLKMDDAIKGNAVGLFFFGYLVLQIPSGYLASRWSPRKLVSIFLVFWGLCAIGCGLVANVTQFEVMRFALGVAESGVYPATLVLLANWFPQAERARANAYWILCQPLAVAGAAPITGWFLGSLNLPGHADWNWRLTLMMEGALPLLWLPVWWHFISDRPRDAKWISPAGTGIPRNHPRPGGPRTRAGGPSPVLARAAAAGRVHPDSHLLSPKRRRLRLQHVPQRGAQGRRP